EKSSWRLKAMHGVDFDQIPVDNSFCTQRLLLPGLMLIADTRKDGRFSDNPLVTGTPGIHFFASVPLVNADGFITGFLCVADKKTRRLSAKQVAALQKLGKQANSFLDLNDKVSTLNKGSEPGNSVEQMSAIFYNAVD